MDVPHSPKRLLVTGASGFLGWNICISAPREWETFGTVFSHEVKIPDATTTKVDLTNFEDLKRLLKYVKPDALIHTAAASEPDYCESHTTESHKINVDAAVNLAGLCADQNVPYLFTSSDLVFDGLNAPYIETDPLFPVNIYGKQKVLAEHGIRKVYPEAIICRMPLMFGHPGPVAASFIQPFLKAKSERKVLKLFVDEFRTPVSAKTAVSGIFLALQKVRGVIHLGGMERISRYEFGKLMVKILGINNATLIPSRQRDIVMPAPRPADVSLDSNRAIALGYRPLPLARELREIFQST